MHNEDVPLGLNVIPIFVAAQCYWMRKFREFFMGHKHVFESMQDIRKKNYRHLGNWLYFRVEIGDKSYQLSDMDPGLIL